MTNDWQPIDTAPKDGTEILASDYDSIEIIFWEGGVMAGWLDRDYRQFFPAFWQPLPVQPEPPASPTT
jgi:hypothetical protein